MTRAIIVKTKWNRAKDLHSDALQQIRSLFLPKSKLRGESVITATVEYPCQWGDRKYTGYCTDAAAGEKALVRLARAEKLLAGRQQQYRAYLTDNRETIEAQTQGLRRWRERQKKLQQLRCRQNSLDSWKAGILDKIRQFRENEEPTNFVCFVPGEIGQLNWVDPETQQKWREAIYEQTRQVVEHHIVIVSRKCTGRKQKTKPIPSYQLLTLGLIDGKTEQEWWDNLAEINEKIDELHTEEKEVA